MQYITIEIRMPDGDVHLKKIPFPQRDGRIEIKEETEYYTNGKRVKKWEFDEDKYQIYIEL